MRRWVFLHPIHATLILSTLFADAQSSATSSQSHQAIAGNSGAYTLHVDAEEVVLNCTVLDRKMDLVNDLTKNNFRVFEDNTLQRIISLQHQDTPVSIGLIVDSSGSMNSKRVAVGAAAIDLIKISNPLDETFVINFSDQAYLDQDFTSDIDRLQRGLSRELN